MSNTKQFSHAMQEALRVAEDITPSVLALAKVAKINASELAKVIDDNEAVSHYRNEVATALMPLFVKRAVVEAKKAKEV